MMASAIDSVSGPVWLATGNDITVNAGITAAKAAGATGLALFGDVLIHLGPADGHRF